MPVENMEEQGLEKNPKLEISQWMFSLTLPAHKNDTALKKKLLDAIKEDQMAPLYEHVCRHLEWPQDAALLKTMQTSNAETLSGLDARIQDAEQNLSEMEVREANLAKAEHLCRIGDKEGAISAFRQTYDKTVSLGQRLDIVFHLIRIGLFHMDHELVNANIDKAKTLIEEGGDWDRRNRLKVYQAVYNMAVRDFKTAAQLFLDTISTFTSYELMDYVQFVKYAVYCSVIALPRQQLRKQVVRGSEILEVLHAEPEVRQFVFSMYECDYSLFFRSLAGVEEVLRGDRYLAPHANYYVREMRIMAYSQLLESYNSLTLQYMADAFGVSPSFIDKELARFIYLGRLHAKIDKVAGVVETNRPDSKNHQYQNAIKQGDILLNRIQKLSRVINI